MVEMLKGIAASDGVAVKSLPVSTTDLSFSKVSVEDTAAEEARLDDALAVNSGINKSVTQQPGEAEASI